MVAAWFFDDLRENLLIVGIVLLVVGGTLAVFTTVDGQVRFALRSTDAYFSSPPEADLQFTAEQVDLLNEVSASNIGTSPVGGEKLFCFSVTNQQVTELRFADRIDASTLTSVAGGCRSRFGEDIDGFIHSQPGFNAELSEEDRNVESAISYSCIQFDEIVEGLTGSVGGLNCWSVTGTGADAEFTAITVGIE